MVPQAVSVRGTTYPWPSRRSLPKVGRPHSESVAHAPGSKPLHLRPGPWLPGPGFQALASDRPRAQGILYRLRYLRQFPAMSPARLPPTHPFLS